MAEKFNPAAHDKHAQDPQEALAADRETHARLQAGLEDTFRPDFFKGVATVVAKLFTQVTPDIAIFGEKDYQQLKVVTRMARDLDLAVKVIGAPTVREADGLAMSSRNGYLSPEDRQRAAALPRLMREAAGQITRDDVAAALSGLKSSLLAAGFESVDYAELANAQDLTSLTTLGSEAARLFVAARIGGTRLIDNMAVE